jgi:hypothetical protein
MGEKGEEGRTRAETRSPQVCVLFYDRFHFESSESGKLGMISELFQCGFCS